MVDSVEKVLNVSISDKAIHLIAVELLFSIDKLLQDNFNSYDNIRLERILSDGAMLTRVGA